MKTNSQRQCIGRFAFATPASLKLAGRVQEIYGTYVSTVSPPNGGINAYWAGRLTEIAVPAKTFELEPGVRASWSSRNSTFPDSLTLEVAKVIDGGRILVAHRDVEKGREDLAKQLFSLILGTYVSSNNHGFCLESGALMSEPSESETVRLTLEDKVDDQVELRFETQTVAKPVVPAQTDALAIAEYVVANGGWVNVLREHQRSVDGLRGPETWVEFSAPKTPPTVNFRWHFAGVGDDSSQPSIDIQASAPAGKRAELEEIWESVMTTLKKVPLPPAGAK